MIIKNIEISAGETKEITLDTGVAKICIVSGPDETDNENEVQNDN